MTLRFNFSCLIFLFLFIISPISAGSQTTEPRQIVLTWQGDTQTTMTITWRTDEPVARTTGMKLIDDAYESDANRINFQDVRKNLVNDGWEKSGYESPEKPLLHLP